jgi:2-hydroxychromene-2-carboxylate isomerase
MLSIMPQRALIYIKKTCSAARYEAAIQQAYETVWTLPTEAQLDISVPDNLVTALTKNGLFSEAEAREIIKSASLPEIKEALTKNTEFAAKELGAFGAPWFWVTNGEGRSEPFFGSDRFHFMWEFLGLPYQRVELLPPAGSKL